MVAVRCCRARSYFHGLLVSTWRVTVAYLALLEPILGPSGPVVMGSMLSASFWPTPMVGGAANIAPVARGLQGAPSREVGLTVAEGGDGTVRQQATIARALGTELDGDSGE